MKDGQRFVIRGSDIFPTTGTFNKQLIADDGQPNIGYRIISFKIVPQTYEGQAVQWSDAIGFLTTSLSGLSRIQFSDPHQLAWAMFDNTTGSGIESDPSFELVDPQVFVRELWLRAWMAPNTANAADYNYWIELERIHLTDIEALVFLATETSI